MIVTYPIINCIDIAIEQQHYRQLLIKYLNLRFDAETSFRIREVLNNV